MRNAQEIAWAGDFVHLRRGQNAIGGEIQTTPTVTVT